jgi:aspartate carbamoyltransferase catalytic subunit
MTKLASSFAAARMRVRPAPIAITTKGGASHEHPTQTILDALARTFSKTQAIIGNLRDHRTAHSLAKGLGRPPLRPALSSASSSPVLRPHVAGVDRR